MNASREESVETGDESIEAGEKHNNHVINGNNAPINRERSWYMCTFRSKTLIRLVHAGFVVSSYLFIWFKSSKQQENICGYTAKIHQIIVAIYIQPRLRCMGYVP